MIQGNLALKLEEFEEDYCCPHLVDSPKQDIPDNIIQFPVKNISRTNDILNKLTQITYPNDSVVKYEYDKVSNRTSVTDPSYYKRYKRAKEAKGDRHLLAQGI